MKSRKGYKMRDAFLVFTGERESMEKDEKQHAVTGRFNLESKYWRLFLVVVAAALTFGGPYVVYLFSHGLDLGFYVSAVAGFGSLIIGLALFWYLINHKVIS